MLKDYIQDLYVVEDSGLCVFHKSLTKDQTGVDDTLVSSFLSAIETFSNNIRTNVNKIAMLDFEFIYHRFANLLFIARIRNGIEDGNVLDILQKISTTFNSISPNSDFSGDVTKYRVIGDIIDNELALTTEFIHMASTFEISGKRGKISNPIESKLYSLLRLKGRINVKQICKYLKLSEGEAIKGVKQLKDDEMIIQYS